MRIAIGCDHRGLNLKLALIKSLTEAGYTHEDFGSYTTDPVDYPDIAKSVAERVVSGDFEHGILICGTGIGMSIAANKVKGIRAALCHDIFSAQRARQHNDANVLCLGVELKEDTAVEITRVFLNGKFEGGRHTQRLKKIKDMERHLSD